MGRYKKNRKVQEQEDWGFSFWYVNEFNSQFLSRIDISCTTRLEIGTY